MTEQLNELTAIMDAYHKAANPSGDQLNRSIKNVSAILFYLTNERIKAHKEYTAIMFDRGTTKVNAQTIVADKEVPELYQLRHITKAGYECLNAMRSNLTSLRKEREYSNTQT
jgi:hypothetical protein